MEEAEENSTVLAVDPGSIKCGVAVVRRSGEIVFRDIFAAENLVEEVRSLIAAFHPVALLVGRGTGSKPLLQALEAARLLLPVTPVEEGFTSEVARARYLAENPARGWQRLLPRSLRTPPRPVDDYAAVILAERFWQTTEERG